MRPAADPGPECLEMCLECEACQAMCGSTGDEELCRECEEACRDCDECTADAEA